MNTNQEEKRRILRQCPISGFADEIDVSVDKQIDLLQRLGIGWVELRSADGINVADLTVPQAQALREKLDQAGIRVSAVGSPIGKIDIAKDFAPHFEAFLHVGQIARILGTDQIRMFSFYMPKGEEPARYREAVLERVGRMVDAAAAQGLVLLHENEKDIYGDRADRCLDLMREFYGAHFKCTFDFANFVQCGQDTLEAYEMLRPYIHYIHVKDALWENGAVVPAGQGDGHVAEILERLDAAGYEGFLSLEPHLADFVGLKKLEQDVRARGNSDGERAFRLANDALRALLR